MWFRTLLIMVLIYFVARSVAKLLRPKGPERQVKGGSAVKKNSIDESRIQDATFKDISEK